MNPNSTPSPLRYPGGKSRVAGKLARLFPDFGEFREPFVGGGSVFLALAEVNPSARYWINDLYPEVANFWEQAKESLPALVKGVDRVRKSRATGRETYSQLRSWKTLDPIDAAVRFFVLNRITFSGLSDSGGFSQMSFDSRFTDSAVQRLRGLSVLEDLDLRITNKDYSTLLNKPGRSVALYLDPPYITKWQKLYGKGGNLHKGFDHERFAKEILDCKHNWVVSYNDGEAVRNLFPEPNNLAFMKWQQHYPMKAPAGHLTNRGKELIISNFNLGDELK